MVDRRAFLKSMAVMAAAPYAAGAASAQSGEEARALQKPKRLKAGDTVGLFAPAGTTLENEDIRFAVDVLESFQFKVKQGKNLYKRWGYLAGSDEERAADINDLFTDDAVDGLITLRGGYGTQRLLPFLNYEAIAKNPKVMMGYSDITALLTAVHQRCNMVTFHGPIARQSYSDYTLAEMKKIVFDGFSGDVGTPPPFEPREGDAERANRLVTIVGGKARGPLIGGNLSLVCSLMGTPYEPDFRGKIVFLEDVGEEPYRLDRMITHLWLTGKLDQAAGFVLGKFTNADIEGNSLSLEQIFEHRFKLTGKPCLRGSMIGHVRDQTTLPLGIEAELDAGAGVLKTLASAVS